jgi:hypothetical protein
MAVHAHPDDEATSTGGVLARYAAEGISTVLVTCTDGRCGDGPDGVKPGDPGHDPDAVVAMRQDELAASCEALTAGCRRSRRAGPGRTGDPASLLTGGPVPGTLQINAASNARLPGDIDP